MDETASIPSMSEQDRRISEVVEAERSRLGGFIRRRVPDPSDVEDIVQEVFLAHEVEGQSFQQIAARTGTHINTLLSGCSPYAAFCSAASAWPAVPRGRGSGGGWPSGGRG
jgi:DNA-directed RNA polymerase specialized sigma24 family protein